MGYEESSSIAGSACFHGLAKGRQAPLVFRTAALVGHLPVADAIGLGMSIPGSRGPHRRVDAAIEVLHLVRGIPGRAAGDSDAYQGLGADEMAELDELLEARPGRLQAAPGPERPAAVGVADRVTPLEIAKARLLERTSPEPDDPGTHRLHRRDDVGSPAGNRVLGHERCVIQPERPRPAKRRSSAWHSSRWPTARAGRDISCHSFDRRQLGRGEDRPFAVEQDADGTLQPALLQVNTEVAGQPAFDGNPVLSDAARAGNWFFSGDLEASPLR